MISLVAAMTKERVIGIGNRLPWHMGSESKHYEDIVRGKTIIMGRRVYMATKRNGRLIGLHNIVLTRSGMYAKGVDVCHSLDEAISKGFEYGPDIYIIGGEGVFKDAISKADTMQLSFIKSDYPGDRFFPEFSESEWEEKSREDFPEFEYVVYVRKVARD